MDEDFDDELQEVSSYCIDYNDRILSGKDTKAIDQFGFWVILVVVLAITLGVTFEWFRRRA